MNILKLFCLTDMEIKASRFFEYFINFWFGLRKSEFKNVFEKVEVPDFGLKTVQCKGPGSIIVEFSVLLSILLERYKLQL